MNNIMSMKATCLLMKMLDKPDNWDYTINGMKTLCAKGYDAIRSALKELEKFGFLERRKVRDSRGRYTDTEYIIYEEPISRSTRSGYPESENSPVINKEINKSSSRRLSSLHLLLKLEYCPAVF